MINFNQYSLEDLSQLNKDLVDHLKVRHQVQSQKDMDRFELHDRVSFTTDDGRIIEGEIIRFNQKTRSQYVPTEVIGGYHQGS